MGLFSKKTIVCENCGKEYEARITLGEHLCSDCSSRITNKRLQLNGYVEYAMVAGLPSYNREAQLDEIAARRQQTLEKYRMTEGISRAELQMLSDNYKKLTDEQAAQTLIRISNSNLTATMGAAYTGYFFVPTRFSGTIVNGDDVFAVGFTSNHELRAEDREVILCGVFTNDPYLPVFPMVYTGKLGFFELSKSKKGREDVKGMYEAICPNLTYPVQDIKELKKQIKLENSVRGNIDVKFMLKQISDMSSSVGVFDTKRMFSDLSPESAAMLDQYGYIQEDEINRILKMDKMFNRNYWNKQIQKLLKTSMPINSSFKAHEL